MLATLSRGRGEPRLSDAVATTGAIAFAVGVLLIAIDIYADHPGRGAPVALFAALVVVGYLVLLLLPKVLWPAGITAIVIGVPGALGWWLLPHAHKFADIRPFLLLTIAAMIVCVVAPRSRGRAVFVAVALLFLFFWLNGEVAGSDAYSAKPLPSPPPNTSFSLAALNQRLAVTIDDLDSSDPLYPLAQRCDDGNMSACDSLYFSAPVGSDFRQFGADCGNSGIGSQFGRCASAESGSGADTGTTNPFQLNPRVNVGVTTHDKSFEIGMVSLLLGLAYLGALLLIDRRSYTALATAFVAPAFVALFSGTESLGNATHHAWAGGIFTFIAGLVFGAVGHATGRRFTTWAGGFMVAFGAVTIALDAAHIRHSVSSGNVKLAGPGFIVMAFGVGLVATAYIVAEVLGRIAPAGGAGGGGGGSAGGSGGGGGSTPAAAPVAPAGSPAAISSLEPWVPPAPPAPPASEPTPAPTPAPAPAPEPPAPPASGPPSWGKPPPQWPPRPQPPAPPQD